MLPVQTDFLSGDNWLLASNEQQLGVLYGFNPVFFDENATGAKGVFINSQGSVFKDDTGTGVFTTSGSAVSVFKTKLVAGSGIVAPANQMAIIAAINLDIAAVYAMGSGDNCVTRVQVYTFDVAGTENVGWILEVC